jgi:hypothetical protein
MTKEDIKQWAITLGVIGLIAIWVATVVAVGIRIFVYILGA